VSAAIAVRVVRHQCPHCRRTWAHKAAAEAHIGRCWRNPAARGCKTCSNFMPPEPGPYPEHPGWSEECGAGRDLPDGGLLAGCPLWEPREVPA
jgi:hypothetical protein